MSSTKFPLKVWIMDDDYLARWMAFFLLSRHLGTLVCAEADSPEGLVVLSENLQGDEVIPDVVLVDVEYHSEKLPPEALITFLKSRWPDARVICTSQYVQPEIIHSIIQAGADGFLVKGEVGLALASAVICSHQGKLVVTPAIKPIIERSFPYMINRMHCLPIWVPNPNLTPQILRSFLFKGLFSMRSKLVAQELGIAKGSVDKYVANAYQILQSDWSDDSSLAGINIDSLSAEDQAFHWFTLPPRKRYS
jgi:DNA-binding NarL/FixJ family response regulator